MIESIKLRDFRGIKTGSIEGFRKINLLVGPNNSGKSAVLEAIYMACANSRKASLTIEEYGSTYFVAAIAETDLLGDHPMHRVLAKHNYSKRLEDLSDYEPGKISVQQTNQKIALPIFDLTSFGKFQNGDEIHAATFGLELQDPDEPSDKNRIAEIQQRLLNLLKNAEPLETLIHELEDKKRDAPAELERDVEDQKLFSEIDKEIAELDERLNPIRSQQRELNRQTEDISKALSERQEKIRRLAKSLMKPIEDGFTEGRLLYCWHPRLSYKYKGDAAWIVKGKIPSAPRTIFYDVSKVTGYISWDFIQLNLMRETVCFTLDLIPNHAWFSFNPHQKTAH
jgi:predicted GTPase